MKPDTKPERTEYLLRKVYLKYALEKRLLCIKNVFTMYTVKISQECVYTYAHNVNLLGRVEYKYQKE
jgi:hypothetical protein